jgi:hypothetical protein
MTAIVTTRGAGVVIVDDVESVGEADGSTVLKDGDGNTVSSFLTGDVAKIELV